MWSSNWLPPQCFCYFKTNTRWWELTKFPISQLVACQAQWKAPSFSRAITAFQLCSHVSEHCVMLHFCFSSKPGHCSSPPRVFCLWPSLWSLMLPNQSIGHPDGHVPPIACVEGRKMAAMGRKETGWFKNREFFMIYIKANDSPSWLKVIDGGGGCQMYSPCHMAQFFLLWMIRLDFSG